MRTILSLVFCVAAFSQFTFGQDDSALKAAIIQGQRQYGVSEFRGKGPGAAKSISESEMPSAVAFDPEKRIANSASSASSSAAGSFQFAPFMSDYKADRGEMGEAGLYSLKNYSGIVCISIRVDKQNRDGYVTPNQWATGYTNAVSGYGGCFDGLVTGQYILLFHHMYNVWEYKGQGLFTVYVHDANGVEMQKPLKIRPTIENRGPMEYMFYISSGGLGRNNSYALKGKFSNKKYAYFLGAKEGYLTSNSNPELGASADPGLSTMKIPARMWYNDTTDLSVGMVDEDGETVFCRKCITEIGLLTPGSTR